jgi:hypothetical protein
MDIDPETMQERKLEWRRHQLGREVRRSADHAMAIQLPATLVPRIAILTGAVSGEMPGVVQHAVSIELSRLDAIAITNEQLTQMIYEGQAIPTISWRPCVLGAYVVMSLFAVGLRSLELQSEWLLLAPIVTQIAAAIDNEGFPTIAEVLVESLDPSQDKPIPEGLFGER